VGVSGVYSPDDPLLLEHFESKGLNKEVMWSIMEAGLSGARAATALPRASPVALLLGGVLPPDAAPDGASSGAGSGTGTPCAGSCTFAAAAAALMPPVTLCHGGADASSPASQSARFAAALRGAGAARVEERYYPGKSHTDPFLEDPILGGEDALLEDILALAHGAPPGATWPRFPRMLPRAVVALARRCIPF
jgi:prenylcysteine alpha-carboxyl methylesterase